LLHDYRIGDKLFFYYNISEGNNENKLFVDELKVHLIYLKNNMGFHYQLVTKYLNYHLMIFIICINNCRRF